MSSQPTDERAIETAVGPYRGEKPRAEREEPYRELVGFVPPRIRARMAITGALDPELFDMQEEMRQHVMYSTCFDVKTTQLMLFAILLAQLTDAAQLHAIAARRAGATWEELQGVVSLCFLFRGLSAANRGAEILAHIASAESSDNAGA